MTEIIIALVSSPSGQVTTITFWDGAPDRLVNLYRGRGVPKFGRREGSWFVFEASEKAPDLGLDPPDIRFFLCFSTPLLEAMDIDTLALSRTSRGNQKFCPTCTL